MSKSLVALLHSPHCVSTDHQWCDPTRLDRMNMVLRTFVPEQDPIDVVKMDGLAQVAVENRLSSMEISEARLGRTLAQMAARMVEDQDWEVASHLQEKLALFHDWMRYEPHPLPANPEPVAGLDEAVLMESIDDCLSAELFDYSDYCATRQRLSFLLGVKADSFHLSQREWLSFRCREIQGLHSAKNDGFLPKESLSMALFHIR